MSKKIDFRLDKVGKPPEGVAWIWHTIELRASPAWKARSVQCARLLDFLEMEHMRHGGAENGFLNATYSQLTAAGIPRKFVSAAIAEAEALGLLDAHKGIRWSRTQSQMTSFRLTYLPAKVVEAGYQGGKPYYTAPTDDWKRVTAELAADISMRATTQRAAGSAGRKTEIRCPDREPDQYPNGNSTSSQSGTTASETRIGAGPENARVVPDREHPSISWADAGDRAGPHDTGSTSLQPTATDMAGRQHETAPVTAPPSPIQNQTGPAEPIKSAPAANCSHLAGQIDLEDLLGGRGGGTGAVVVQIAPQDRIRAEAMEKIQREGRGAIKRLAARAGLSRTHMRNFLHGTYALNRGALAVVEAYIAEPLSDEACP